MNTIHAIGSANIDFLVKRDLINITCHAIASRPSDQINKTLATVSEPHDQTMYVQDKHGRVVLVPCNDTVRYYTVAYIGQVVV